MEKSWHLRFRQPTDLSDMTKASKYGDLKCRGREDVGRAKGREEGREREGKAEWALAAVFFSSWESFLECDGF